MSDIKQLWENACIILKREMNSVSYETFIVSLIKPHIILNNKLYLELINEDFLAIFNNRYLQQIENAVQRTDSSIKGVEIYPSGKLDSIKEEKEKNDKGSKNLNKRYTFENFVVGSNNRFVYTVALAVAEMPAVAYNPLFIHGGVGLGKTHLLHAVGNYVHETKPELNVKYVTGETFMNELIHSMRVKDNNQHFRNSYRNLDILMVDDIHFIAGKTSTQEEFFHTFNALHEMGKQIIMTSDKAPSEISHLEKRLESRFQWGLIADIQSPDIETRIAILRKKAELMGLVADDDVYTLIAERVDSNIRELEGSLTKLHAFSSLKNRPIDINLAKEALRDTFSRKPEVQASCDRIQTIVSSYFGISVDDLKSPRRSRDVTEPRQIAMYLTRELLCMSFPRIGLNFGNRDHSTVSHACNKVSEAVKNSPRFAAQITDLIKMININ